MSKPEEHTGLNFAPLERFLTYKPGVPLRWNFHENVEGSEEDLERFFKLLVEVDNKRNSEYWWEDKFYFTQDGASDVFYEAMSTHFFSKLQMNSVVEVHFEFGADDCRL